MTKFIFDTKSFIKSKDKAVKDWQRYNFVFEKFSQILYEKVSETNIKFQNVLLITSDFFETLNVLLKFDIPKITIVSQYEEMFKKLECKKNVQKVLMPFEDISIQDEFDLVICNFNLHKINNKLDYLKKLKELLSTKGMLFCNFFGEGTLYELRNSLLKTDEKIYGGIFTRMEPSLKMIDISNLFSTIGFKEIVSEIINYEVFYKNVINLLNDIKGMGEVSALKNRKKSLITKNYLSNLNKIYKDDFSDSKKTLKATCNIISSTMWNNT